MPPWQQVIPLTVVLTSRCLRIFYPERMAERATYASRVYTPSQYPPVCHYLHPSEGER